MDTTALRRPRPFRMHSGVATNPCPGPSSWGPGVGPARWSSPSRWFKPLGLLADGPSPVALFTIGAVLARSQIMARAGEAHPRALDGGGAGGGGEAVLAPVVGAADRCCRDSDRHPPSRFALTVLVLLAALPSASNVSAGRTLWPTTDASPASFWCPRRRPFYVCRCRGLIT